MELDPKSWRPAAKRRRELEEITALHFCPKHREQRVERSLRAMNQTAPPWRISPEILRQILENRDEEHGR